MSRPTPEERRFVNHLVSLTEPTRRDGRASLAALRRGLGRVPGTVAEAYPIVVPFAPAGPGWNADRYYLVASLFATHPENWVNQDGDDRRTNLGASLRRARGESGGVEAHLVSLLNSERDQLKDRLPHSVGLCAAGQPAVPVDWAQLLADLLRWNDERRRVQRRWAASFWQHETPEEEE